MKAQISYRKIISLLLFSLFLFTVCGCKKTVSLEKITPEEAGFSSEKLSRVSEYAGEIGSAAITILSDGKIFYSWGNTGKNYACHSIRKPLLGALYGIYIEKGIINPYQTLSESGIDDIPPELTDTEKQAVIKDLLMSRSGIYHEAAAESEKMKKMRPERGTHLPGTFFYYNNWDFNALGTIFEKCTGEKIFKSFKNEIAEKIGMEDFSPWDCSYRYEKDLSEHPAYIFKMSSRDMARFGLLYMNYGKWEGEQVVPAGWIRESTRSYSFKCLNGDDYGYLWSIIPETAIPGGGFYHTGYKNHFLGILPEEKLVVVHRGEGVPGIKQEYRKMKKLLYMIMSAAE